MTSHTLSPDLNDEVTHEGMSLMRLPCLGSFSNLINLSSLFSLIMQDYNIHKGMVLRVDLACIGMTNSTFYYCCAPMYNVCVSFVVLESCTNS